MDEWQMDEWMDGYMDSTKGTLKKEKEYNDPYMGVHYVIMGYASVTHEQTLLYHISRLWPWLVAARAKE